MQQKRKDFTGAAGAAFTDTGSDARYGARTVGSRECGEVANTPVPPPLSGGDSGGGAAAPRLEKRTY